MKSIGDRELSVMQRILLSNDQTHKVNKTLLWLSDEYGIGRVSKGEITFTSSCISALRQVYRRHSKMDEFQKRSTGGTRIDRAKQSLNEKSGALAVFERMLWVRSAQPIPICNSPGLYIPLALDAYISIDWLELNLDALRFVIIVENGSMFRVVKEWLCLMPEEWRDALVVYRGHNSTARSVNSLLESLPEHVRVAVYADFDLGGLRIIQGYLKYRALGFFVPEQWEQLDRNYQHSDETRFRIQFESIKPKFSCGNLQKVADRIVKNRLAVMHENFESIGALVYLDAG